MTETGVENLLMIFSSIMIIVNYVFTAIAMFKISKKEQIGKPFFAWIPILNDYLLIKLGQGSIYFMILALLSLGLGSPMAIRYLSSSSLLIGATVCTAIWALYKIVLYNRICDRYNTNVIIIGAGFIMQLMSKLSAVGLIVSVVGQILLIKKVESSTAPKTIIESKIVLSKRQKKEGKK